MRCYGHNRNILWEKSNFADACAELEQVPGNWVFNAFQSFQRGKADEMISHIENAAESCKWLV